MRKLITTITFVCAAIAACTGASAVDREVKVYLDNRKIKLDPPAIMRDGKTYIGLRSAAKALDATVKWDDKTKTAIVTAENKRTKIPQSKGMTINGALFLPLRLTGEALGCTVEWDSSRSAVMITTEAPCPTGGG